MGGASSWATSWSVSQRDRYLVLVFSNGILHRRVLKTRTRRTNSCRILFCNDDDYLSGMDVEHLYNELAPLFLTWCILHQVGKSPAPFFQNHCIWQWFILNYINLRGFTYTCYHSNINHSFWRVADCDHSFWIVAYSKGLFLFEFPQLFEESQSNKHTWCLFRK